MIWVIFSGLFSGSESFFRTSILYFHHSWTVAISSLAIGALFLSSIFLSNLLLNSVEFLCAVISEPLIISPSLSLKWIGLLVILFS